MPPLSETQNAELRLRSVAGRILLFFTAYLACAAAGRLFSSATLPFVSFWLPSGLMVATLLRQESRDWPVFAAAAFLANLGFDLANGQAIAIGLLFATGNCLEALAGAWLLRRLVASRPDLSTVREVWGLLGLSAVLSTTISATIGALTIAVVMGRGSFADTWPLWWSGDALGVLLMAPLILAWRNNSPWMFGRAALARQMEAGALIVVVGIVATYSFNDVWHPQVSLGYLLLPCGLWAAFRFGPQVTAAVNLVGALFAAWFTAHGYSDIAKSGLVAPSQIATLQLFLAVVALTGLFMCAVMAERRKTEAALRFSEQQLRSYVEHAGDAIYVVAQDSGRIISCNQEACRNLGYRREELLQMSPRDIETEFKPAEIERIHRALNENPKLQLEGVHRRKDGTTFPVEINLSRLDGAEPPSLLSLVRDITERKRTEEALKASERQYRSYVESSPIGVFVCDERGRYLQVNPAAAAITGYRIEELIQMSIADITPPECLEESLRHFQSVLQTGRASGESVFRHKDGHRGYWLVEAVRLSSTRFLGFASDITERKQTEERMRKQVTLLDSANDAIYVRALDHTITYWNGGAERLYGLSLQQVMGRKITEFGGKDHAAFDAAHAMLLAEGSWKGELREPKKDAAERIISCRWTLLRDEQGLPKEVLAIDTDATDQKQLEAQLLRAQRMEGIGMLAGGIAHDLNNILTPIMMSTSLLRNVVRDDENRQLLDSMQSSARRGADIIRQLLTFARGQPGVHAPVPVRQLLREMEKLIRETFPRNLCLAVTVDSELWLVVGDPTQIHQALMNLCVNARDAMADGGTLTLAADNVTLDAASAAPIPDVKPGPHVRLRVSDTGIGIPPAQLEHIFDPFFTTKEIGKGTGLGLPTVLGIMRGHGGSVRVVSCVGQGTTFELYLPASPEAAAAFTPQRESRLPHGHGELILVVDDEAAVRGSAQYVLEKYGYRVLTAAEGGEALKLFDRHRSEIKAVLTDMMMPGIDGPKLVRTLRQLDARLPILGMTGLIERGTFKGLDGLESVPLLAKPFELENLIVALHQTLTTGKPTTGSAN